LAIDKVRELEPTYHFITQGFSGSKPHRSLAYSLQISSLTRIVSSRSLRLSHNDLLTKGVDPSALPATRLLPATQEILQQVVQRQPF
jgi:hypothetical protein